MTECNKILYNINLLNKITSLFKYVFSGSIRYMLTSSGYLCNNCGRTYKYVKNLKRHIKEECGKEPKFQCQFCPHRAKQKSNLQSHVYTKHIMKWNNVVKLLFVKFVKIIYIQYSYNLTFYYIFIQPFQHFVSALKQRIKSLILYIILIQVT